MTIQLTLAAAALLAVGCLQHRPVASSRHTGTPLCRDPASATGTAVEVNGEEPTWESAEEQERLTAELAGALDDAWRVDIVARGPEGDLLAATTSAACERDEARPCAARLVRISGGTELRAMAPLPAAVPTSIMGMEPNTVIHLGLADVDGDGEAEVVVSYSVAGVPEPGVGSTSTQHLAVFDANSLELRASMELGRTPEASSLEVCRSTLLIADANCDNHVDLIQTMSCGWESCVGVVDEIIDPDLAPCGGLAVTHSVHLWGPDGYYTLSPG